MRSERLEALVLALLGEERSFEEVYALVRARLPQARRPQVFGLLVRLVRQGRVLHRAGHFRRAP